MLNWRKSTVKFKIALLLIVIALPLFARASPGTAICLASSLVGEKIPGAHSIRASASYTETQILTLSKLVDNAVQRVDEQLWQTVANPEILFLDGNKVFGLLDYNNYGSAYTLPHKTCLLIGTQGTNIDVLAHEYVHADIAARLGYWRYFFLPKWLNEGVAMQVDARKRYDPAALNGDDPTYVKSKNGSEFYRGGSEQVVKNYTAAKSIVKSWIEKNGEDVLLNLLQYDEAKLQRRL